LEGRGRRISEFKASLVYKVSSRTARTTQRNSVSKNKKQKQQTNKQTNKQKKREGPILHGLIAIFIYRPIGSERVSTVVLVEEALLL